MYYYFFKTIIIIKNLWSINYKENKTDLRIFFIVKCIQKIEVNEEMNMNIKK